MAPSAPLSPPPLVSPACGPSERLVPTQSSGNTLGSATKLPGKSNLKQSSAGPSTSKSGNTSSALEVRDAKFGNSHEGGNGEAVRGISKVQWNDNFGKELTQVFEFEPSVDSGDSEDDDDDLESPQACMCVIQ